ncbi:MAG: hypothetical protein R2779_03110 [Crocinitomicaceae bacterium]
MNLVHFFHMKHHIMILYLLLANFNINAQIVLYQDVFHGGATGGGFSTGMGIGGGTINLHIESGSTIRKAYIFAYSSGKYTSENVTINGVDYKFNILNRITSVSITNPNFTPINLHYIDITDELNILQTSIFNISIDAQPYFPFEGVFAPYIYISYENNGLPVFNTSIIVNNQNLIGNEFYNINILNPISSNTPVGFSIYSDRSEEGSPPSKQVFFNSNLLGVIGGSDNINNLWNYAGVKGHFYYQNNQLFGLDDDTPDAIMGGTDGLADVSSYIQNNATSCNFQLTHINYPNQPVNATSINLAYFLTYTSPCQPFDVSVVKDTTICQGATIQLNASGGQSYEWLSPTSSTSSNPALGLSCSNCPNPIFTADSSMFLYGKGYGTMILQQAQHHSVVRPVRINVLPQPQIGNVTLKPSECGTTNGSITITGTNLKELFAISESGDTTSVIGNILTGLVLVITRFLYQCIRLSKCRHACNNWHNQQYHSQFYGNSTKWGCTFGSCYYQYIAECTAISMVCKR